MSVTGIKIGTKFTPKKGGPPPPRPYSDKTIDELFDELTDDAKLAKRLLDAINPMVLELKTRELEWQTGHLNVRPLVATKN